MHDCCVGVCELFCIDVCVFILELCFVCVVSGEEQNKEALQDVEDENQ